MKVFIVILLLLLMATFLVVKEVFSASVVVLVQLHDCLTFVLTLAYKKIGLLVNALSPLTSHLSLLIILVMK